MFGIIKRFEWNDEKNERLKRERAISFEDILFHLASDGLLDVLEHPNPQLYPGQRLFIVNVEGYVCIVPFVEDDNHIFLKTIIPSRKLTKPGLCTRQVRPGCEACGVKLYGHTANPAEQSRRVGIVAPWVNMDEN